MKKYNSKACVSSPQSADFLFFSGLSLKRSSKKKQLETRPGEQNWAHRCIGEDRSHFKTWIWELPVGRTVAVSLGFFQLLLDQGLSPQLLVLAALLCSFSKQFCGFHQSQWVNCLSSARFWLQQFPLCFCFLVSYGDRNFSPLCWLK